MTCKNLNYGLDFIWGMMSNTKHDSSSRRLFGELVNRRQADRSHPSVYQSGFTEEALSYGNSSPPHLMWFRAAVTVWYNTIKRLDTHKHTRSTKEQTWISSSTVNEENSQIIFFCLDIAGNCTQKAQALYHSQLCSAPTRAREQWGASAAYRESARERVCARTV